MVKSFCPGSPYRRIYPKFFSPPAMAAPSRSSQLLARSTSCSGRSVLAGKDFGDLSSLEGCGQAGLDGVRAPAPQVFIQTLEPQNGLG